MANYVRLRCRGTKGDEALRKIAEEMNFDTITKEGEPVRAILQQDTVRGMCAAKKEEEEEMKAAEDAKAAADESSAGPETPRSSGSNREVAAIPSWWEDIAEPAAEQHWGLAMRSSALWNYTNDKKAPDVRQMAVTLTKFQADNQRAAGVSIRQGEIDRQLHEDKCVVCKADCSNR